MNIPRVLLVDDDANLLAGLRRSLDSDEFEISTAQGGECGVDVVSSSGPFAVVVADMRMPGIDGVAFLRQVAELDPHAIRIMLTGNVDQKTAVDAVNEGHVFRFLNKPCEPRDLERAIRDGLRQHALVRAEHELLSQTLTGSVKMVMDLLVLVNPRAAARASRIRRIAHRIAQELRCEKPWEIELAAMMSQIGWIAQPETRKGDSASALLPPPERISHDLIAHIPRLDGVAALLEQLSSDSAAVGRPASAADSTDIQVLRLAIDLDRLVDCGVSTTKALEQLRSPADRYDSRVLDALESMLLNELDARSVAVAPEDLIDGDVVAEDVVTSDGRLLLRSGQEISAALRNRLITSATALGIQEPIRVSGAGRKESLAAVALGDSGGELADASQLVQQLA